jgi:hypothetical protein
VNSLDSRSRGISIGLGRPTTLLAAVLAATMLVGAGPIWAQDRYDDHELTDRFYITAGGFSQTDLRTTIRLDAKSQSGGITVGTIIGLESLFDLDDQVTTGRLDGWYRFGKKHRIDWTYWRTDREGVSTYNGEQPIEIGDDHVILPGDSVVTDDKSQLIAASWSYSFLNTKKYELWLGAGLNFQRTDMTIDVNLGDVTAEFREEAKGTIPVPTLNFGLRWNFGPRWRMLVMQQLFGLDIGDYSGKLENTRLLAEFDITSHFGIGGGFERFNFEVNAESDEFLGELDSSYSAFTLFLKGQI